MSGKTGIHLAVEKPEAHWLAGIDNATVETVFRVLGSATSNDKNPQRPFANVTVRARPLLVELWHLELDSTYGQVDLGSGFKNRWTFRYREDAPIVINSECAWDGGDDWIQNDAEAFARLFATRLGWGVEA
jgi:hypothetical protein